MTLTKESLRSAQRFVGWPDHLVEHDPDPKLSRSPQWETIWHAARFVERLLPAVIHHSTPMGTRCSFCVSDETLCQLWDEGLVEVVAEALFADDLSGASPQAQEMHRGEARTVLAALTQEVGK